MTKILYLITQSEYGGAQRYVLDLAVNLKNDFQIAVGLGEQGDKGGLAEILKQQGVKIFIIPHLKRRISPVNDFLALLEIRKLYKQSRPDVIHLNSSKISILGSLAAVFIKAKIIYTAHGWVFNEPLPYWLKQFYLLAEKLTAPLKDKIICVSDFDRRAALKKKIAPPEKLITIHNGLAPVSFYSREEALSKLAERGIKGGVIIGSIGHLYKTKGYEYFIKAADILINRRGVRAAFVVIGEGSERKNLEKLIARYNLKNNFILAGNMTDAARLLPAFNVYVCSSVKEGLSYTIIEAMQAGLPIAATSVGGNPELIDDNATGLLTQSRNPADLTEKIQRLIEDKNLAARLSQAAEKKARAEFGLDKMIKATRELYK